MEIFSAEAEESPENVDSYTSILYHMRLYDVSNMQAYSDIAVKVHPNKQTTVTMEFFPSHLLPL